MSAGLTYKRKVNNDNQITVLKNELQPCLLCGYCDSIIGWQSLGVGDTLEGSGVASLGQQLKFSSPTLDVSPACI